MGGFGVRAHLRRGWSGRSSRVTQTVARFAWMGRDEARGSARRSGALGELSGRTSSTAVSSDERARGSVRTSRGRAGSRNAARMSGVAIKPWASRFFALRTGVASPPPCALCPRRSSDHLLFSNADPRNLQGLTDSRSCSDTYGKQSAYSENWREKQNITTICREKDKIDTANSVRRLEVLNTPTPRCFWSVYHKSLRGLNERPAAPRRTLRERSRGSARRHDEREVAARCRDGHRAQQPRQHLQVRPEPAWTRTLGPRRFWNWKSHPNKSPFPRPCLTFVPPIARTH